MAANNAQRKLMNMGEDRQKKTTRPRRKEQAAPGGKYDRDDNESNVCGTRYLQTCNCFCCAQQRTALPALNVHLNDDESVKCLQATAAVTSAADLYCITPRQLQGVDCNGRQPCVPNAIS
jgi:hypothetical protein